MSRELIDLPREVVSIHSGEKYTVVGVDLGDTKGVVSYGTFLDGYDEYIDPKDVEINRLLAIIKDLEQKPKKSNAPKRRPTEAEKGDMKTMYEKGIAVGLIASQYEISPSAVYKYAKDRHWEIKGGN